MQNIFSVRSAAGESETNELTKLRMLLLNEGRELKDISLSNPTKVDLERPKELLTLNSARNRFYEPDPKGLFAARENLSRHLRSQGKSVSPDDIFLCASTSEAYSWLFKLLCDPGDKVLIPKPGYPLFEHLAILEHVQTEIYQLEYVHPSGWRINIEALEETLSRSASSRIKAIVVINPNNPTGSYVHQDERQKILDLCEQYGLALISDEVFFEFPLQALVKRTSFVGERSVLTFVLDGLSKRVGLPQMKLSWIAVSGPNKAANAAKLRLELISDTFLSVSTPIMNALPKIFKHEFEFLHQMNQRIHENYFGYKSILEKEQSPHRVLTCEGGWTAIIESPAYKGEERIAQMLIARTGIFAQPGFFFDFDKGVHFAFSLILPNEIAERWCREYEEFYESLKAQ